MSGFLQQRQGLLGRQIFRLSDIARSLVGASLHDVLQVALEGMLAEIALGIERPAGDRHRLPVAGSKISGSLLLQRFGFLAKRVLLGNPQRAAALQPGQEDVKAGGVFEFGCQQLHARPGEIGMRRRPAPCNAAAVGFEGAEQGP